MLLAPRWPLKSSNAERPEAMKILSDAADGSLLQSHSLSAGVHRIRTRTETIFAAVLAILPKNKEP
jgi:hypothetical protein